MRLSVALGAAAAIAGSGWALLAALPPAMPVVRVRRAPIRETVVATGRVLPAARVELGVPIPGVVRAVHVDRGARVQAGQLLLELDTQGLAAAVEARRAALGSSEARLAQLQTTSAAATSAALREADAALQQAESDLRRAHELQAGGVIAPSALEDAEVAAERARSRRTTARAALEDATGADLRGARERVREAAAALREAEARLAEARVLAPGGGLVLERRVEPGDVVAGARTLLVLALDGKARLTLEVDERHLGRVRPGQRARASAEAWPEAVFDATVTSIGPGVDAARGTAEVRLAVPSPPVGLAPDQTVSVEIETGERGDALVLAPEALHEAPDGSRWCAAARQGRLERVRVRTGLRTLHAVEVVEGLSEGALVALGGRVDAMLGRPVRLQEVR